MLSHNRKHKCFGLLVMSKGCVKGSDFIGGSGVAQRPTLFVFKLIKLYVSENFLDPVCLTFGTCQYLPSSLIF